MKGDRVTFGQMVDAARNRASEISVIIDTNHAAYRAQSKVFIPPSSMLEEQRAMDAIANFILEAMHHWPDFKRWKESQRGGRRW